MNLYKGDRDGDDAGNVALGLLCSVETAHHHEADGREQVDSEFDREYVVLVSNGLAPRHGRQHND